MCSTLNNILFASNVNLCLAFLFKIFLKTFSHNTKKLKRNYFNMIELNVYKRSFFIGEVN